jgi:signal transduction histidine kinase
LNVTITALKSRERTMQGVVVSFENVSEQVRMEEQMSHLARLAEIGQMTATIAHELRNPMTAMKGAAQLLEGETLPETAQAYVEIIVEEVSKLTQIADEFLEFAKPLTLARKATDLNLLIERITRVFEPHLRAHQIEVCLDLGDLPTIEADPSRIEQVLHNLIQNALQAMPSGGRLDVCTGCNNGKAWFTLQDQGQGIPENIQKQIFNPFFTTRTKGTGLGLSIVKKIVEAHHGAIEVQSRVAEGATFKVSLPV